MIERYIRRRGCSISEYFYLDFGNNYHLPIRIRLSSVIFCIIDRMVLLSLHFYYHQLGSLIFLYSKSVFFTDEIGVMRFPASTHPAGEPSLHVTETFLSKCSLMSWSSFCDEHLYSDCAKFFTCTMKLSMLASTAVKSSGKLSAPSSRTDRLSSSSSPCCCWERRICARPPGTLLASSGALKWMRSSSTQERTGDTPARLPIIPQICLIFLLGISSVRLLYKSLKEMR